MMPDKQNQTEERADVRPMQQTEYQPARENVRAAHAAGKETPAGIGKGTEILRLGGTVWDLNHEQLCELAETYGNSALLALMQQTMPPLQTEEYRADISEDALSEDCVVFLPDTLAAPELLSEEENGVFSPFVLEMTPVVSVFDLCSYENTVQ